MPKNNGSNATLKKTDKKKSKTVDKLDRDQTISAEEHKTMFDQEKGVNDAMLGETTCGRPLKYKTPEEMQTAIDEYFKRCEGEKQLDDDGKPVFTKHGYLYSVEPKPPTITGLALALGFADRCSLLDYQEKDAFSHTVRVAKSRVEEYAEIRLFDKDGANGAKFSLSNNFKKWKERSDVEHSGTFGVKITDDIE